MASFANAIVLLVTMGSLAWEALGRIEAPAPVSGTTVMLVAAIGMVINAVTAALFLKGSKTDLNIRGAFLHMAADALVSVGVVAAGALYWWRGWYWIDPVVSLVIATVVILGTWSLFRQSLHLLFDGVPEHLNLDEVRRSLMALPDVMSVHDLHVWAMAASENALTAHLVVDDRARPADQLLHAASEMLFGKFGIRHATLQLESTHYARGCESAGCA
nr:cation diffusion facilitator family transporter [Aromatoleum petrolei]